MWGEQERRDGFNFPFTLTFNNMYMEFVHSIQGGIWALEN